MFKYRMKVQRFHLRLWPEPLREPFLSGPFIPVEASLKPKQRRRVPSPSPIAFIAGVTSRFKVFFRYRATGIPERDPYFSAGSSWSLGKSMSRSDEPIFASGAGNPKAPVERGRDEEAEEKRDPGVGVDALGGRVAKIGPESGRGDPERGAVSASKGNGKSRLGTGEEGVFIEGSPTFLRVGSRPACQIRTAAIQSNSPSDLAKSRGCPSFQRNYHLS
jgi:hypothetical protein